MGKLLQVCVCVDVRKYPILKEKELEKEQCRTYKDYSLLSLQEQEQNVRE